MDQKRIMFLTNQIISAAKELQGGKAAPKGAPVGKPKTDAKPISRDPEYDSDMMPFGKYAGQIFADIPDEYLSWAADNMESKKPGDVVSRLRAYIGTGKPSAEPAREPAPDDDIPF